MRCCFLSRGYKSIEVLGGDSRTSGGAEAQVAYLAAALSKLGHDVTIIYGNGNRAHQPRVLSGVTCIDAAPRWETPTTLLSLWKAISDSAPDMLYARLPSDFIWILGLFARLHPPARFIYAMAHDEHCNPRTVFGPNRWFHIPFYGLGLRSAHVIAIQHDHQRYLVAPHLLDKLLHVPNLLREFSDTVRPWRDTTFDAAWVATIRPEKQLAILLDAASALPDLRIAIVGSWGSISGTERQTLEARMTSLPNVTYCGALGSSDVIGLLKKSKLLVNTSSAEGFPNTMLEAWGAGVPVVSLTVDPGGAIARERLGLVSGSLERLIEDVSMLAGNEQLNREYGSLGLDYVRCRHSLDAVCAALTDALQGTDLELVTIPASQT